MVLILGADGRVTDGPVPSGTTTTVVVLFNGRLQQALVQNNPPGGGVNFSPAQAIGLALSSVAKIRTETIGVGAAITQPFKASIAVPVAPGVAVSVLNSGTIAAPHSVGLAVGTTMTNRVDQGVGAELVQIVYNLTARNGSNAATTVGASAPYVNPTNAQGYKNTTLASLNGSVTASQASTLRLGYAAQINKTQLTITAVELRFYTLLISAAASSATSTLRATWTGGSYTGTKRGVAYDETVTGTIVDLYSLGVTDWAKTDSVVAFVDGETIIASTALTASVGVDAVELVITATRTDPL